MIGLSSQGSLLDARSQVPPDLKGARPEPTGFGSSLTNFFPLAYPVWHTISQGATSARLRMTTAEGSTPAVIKHRQPRPKNPADGLPASERPTVAAASGVSPETIRRLLLQTQKPRGQQEAQRFSSSPRSLRAAGSFPCPHGGERRFLCSICPSSARRSGSSGTRTACLLSQGKQALRARRLLATTLSAVTASTSSSSTLEHAAACCSACFPFVFPVQGRPVRGKDGDMSWAAGPVATAQA
jgi:hypothetical protein